MRKKLQKQNSLISFVEEKVQNAQIWPETDFRRKHLIVLHRLEGIVRERMFRADNGTEVVHHGRLSLRNVLFRSPDVRLNVEELTYLEGYLPVEVIQVRPLPLKERVQVIGIELEEWALPVCRGKRVPVEVPPVSMTADAHVALQQLSAFLLRALNRNGESLRTVRCCYDAPVPIRLLYEAVIAFYIASRIPVQLLVPLDGTEIGCGKTGFPKLLRMELMLNIIVRH